MPDLHAPLGAPGMLVLEEHRDLLWRHEPEPREAAVLLDAVLPVGRLVVACNDAVDEVTATLDGVRVGRVHDRALRRQSLMWDGAPGPGLEVGDRTGTLTWRFKGSKLRPLGRLRWFEIDLGGVAYAFWMQGLSHRLARHTAPEGEPVAAIGAGGLDPRVDTKLRGSQIPALDDRRHSLVWRAETTAAELVLVELMELGMATLDLRSLPGKMLSQSVQSRD